MEDQPKQETKSPLSRRIILLCISLLFLIIVIFTLGYKLGTMQTSFPQQTLKPSMQPKPTLKTIKYDKFLYKFNNNGQFLQQPALKSLLDLKENELMGLICTNQYQSNVYGPYDASFYLTFDNQDEEIVSEKQKKAFYYDGVISAASSLTNPQISGIQYCRIDDNRHIVEYQTTWQTKNSGKVFFTLYDTQGAPSKPIEISNPGMTYFGCGEPLLLTKEQKLYYLCSGAENLQVTGNSAQYRLVYEVDFQSGKSKLLETCTVEYDDTAFPPKILDCKVL